VNGAACRAQANGRRHLFRRRPLFRSTTRKVTSLDCEKTLETQVAKHRHDVGEAGAA
jgi:hypothetical protein